MPVVILTQEREDAQRQADELSAAGIRTLVYPCIATRLVSYSGRLPLTRPVLEFDVVAFTSKRGVAGLAPYRDELSAATVVAAVGESTASAVRELLNRRQVLLPERATADDLARMLLTKLPVGNLLHVRGTLGGDAIRPVLEAAGWVVEELIVYENIDPQLEPLYVESRALAVFASHSAVQRFFKTNPNLKSTLQCVAIGPVTADGLRAIGVENVHVAARPGLLLDTVRSLVSGVASL
jgi:uroporphyrinogen-III synthase